MIARVLAVLFATTVVVVAQSSQQPQDQGVLTQQQTAPRPSQQPSPNTPVAPNPAQISPNANKDGAGQANEQIGIQRENLELTRALVRYTEELADYTFWLVFVGGIVGALTIGVLFFQALYTGRAANVAGKTLLIAQRGWAITSDFSISGFAENGSARVSFLVFNTGAIPIKFTGADTHLRIDTDLPDDPSYGERTAFPDPTAIIGPGQQVTLTQNPRVITSDDFTRIVSGSHKLFAYGRIFYTDIFGEHPTGYAVVLSPDLTTFHHVPSKPNYTYSD